MCIRDRGQWVTVGVGNTAPAAGCWLWQETAADHTEALMRPVAVALLLLGACTPHARSGWWPFGGGVGDGAEQAAAERSCPIRGVPPNAHDSDDEPVARIASGELDAASFLEVIKTGKPVIISEVTQSWPCLLYTSPSPRDATLSRMPSSA